MSAFLEIALKIEPRDRASAAAVYDKYKQPFLTGIEGAVSKQLLVRDEDVQVLHGFEDVPSAQAYLKSGLFEKDVVRELSPLLAAPPEIRIYQVA
ncbi:MAG: hypothetical protein KC933_12760 [Myxococcales bacterium]|nr:hypothetical protein [Myxococcales bacterium]